MNKDILLTIKGLQYAMDEDGNQTVETVNRGTFYDKGDKYYITFEESPDGEETVKSLIKFNKEYFELSRKGTFSVHMLFEKGKKNYTDYNTPFGNLVMGIDTEEIEFTETEDCIRVVIHYDMEMNYEHVAKCEIEIKIEPV